MNFPEPPYELFRPLFGYSGADPRKTPPCPPKKRFRLFGRLEHTHTDHAEATALQGDARSRTAVKEESVERRLAEGNAGESGTVQKRQEEGGGSGEETADFVALLPEPGDSFHPQVGREGGPSVRAEFLRLFKSLNHLLVEQCRLLQDRDASVDLEVKVHKILQRKTELMHLLNRLRRSQTLNSLAEMLLNQCEQQEEDIVLLEQRNEATKRLFAQFILQPGSSGEAEEEHPVSEPSTS